jgi:para-aminobenzoate synthetase/4-amino-4-deoxychorismate lyase
MIAPGTILLHDTLTPGGRSLLFTAPAEIVTARTAADIAPALARIADAGADGLWAAGYLAYELGYALEERLRPLLDRPRDLPLVWFGLYAPPVSLDAQEAGILVDGLAGGQAGRAAGITHDIDFALYEQAFERVRALIAAGDAYQVNLTMRARFTLEGNAAALYRDLVGKQRVPFGALIATGEHTILSSSPELFVENQGGALRARPMKGTLARGRTLSEDQGQRQALAADPKNRAENLMIVDLLRNDLGRIATIGSVRVPALFSVETYRSLHQMTSEITATLKPGLGVDAVIANLFPCGSITGAPKLRAMEIIHELEATPRGLYTGAIGVIEPNGDFRFNVAIRTAVIDKEGRGEIGMGGGIVADSTAREEYDEAMLKLKFFTAQAEPVALIETLLWERGSGYALLDRHLSRLLDSARYFAIDTSRAAVSGALNEAAAGFAEPRMRVRLVLAESGALSVTAVPLPAPSPGPMRFMLAEKRLDSASPLLFHKTTNRAFYDAPRVAAAERHGVDEVVFRNERDELTEGSITSLFIERDGLLFTPALSSGLLPGTLRAELIATGAAHEAVLFVDDLAAADAIYLGNSVRGLMTAVWVQPAPAGRET